MEQLHANGSERWDVRDPLPITPGDEHGDQPRAECGMKWVCTREPTSAQDQLGLPRHDGVDHARELLGPLAPIAVEEDHDLGPRAEGVDARPAGGPVATACLRHYAGAGLR